MSAPAARCARVMRYEQTQVLCSCCTIVALVVCASIGDAEVDTCARGHSKKLVVPNCLTETLSLAASKTDCTLHTQDETGLVALVILNGRVVLCPSAGMAGEGR